MGSGVFDPCPAGVRAGKVVVTGSDKASSSVVTLVVMGGHIGVDVGMPTPGKYTFAADIESADKKGSTTFSYTLKKAERNGREADHRSVPSPAAGHRDTILLSSLSRPEERVS